MHRNSLYLQDLLGTDVTLNLVSAPLLPQRIGRQSLVRNAAIVYKIQFMILFSTQSLIKHWVDSNN